MSRVRADHGEAPLTRTHELALSLFKPQSSHLQNGGLAYMSLNFSVGAKNK